MRHLFTFFFALIFSLTLSQKKYVLVLHGGAGTITKESMTPEKEAAYRSELTKALKAGYAEIQKGKTSVDAVQAAIVVMEDSPLFNAGKGAVFTNDGKNELDASIMYGKDKSAGAVAGIHIVKNPIKAAIAVMQKSEHVMMAGEGAEKFAQQQGLEIVDPQYFWTKDRWEGLQKLKQKDAEKLNKTTSNHQLPDYITVDQKFGTVGCVALDKKGNITAGTSTGGMTNKKYGRIGDSPIIGAGTYANSQVGISGTGWGEYFIRSTAARTVAAKMEYQNKNVKTATQETINEIGKMGGDGGLIALDKDGNIAMPFNTAGMYRGAITENGEIEIYIYKEENSAKEGQIGIAFNPKKIKIEELRKMNSLDLEFKNDTSNPILFGSYFILEKFNGKTWQEVPFVKNIAFPSMEYMLNANSSDTKEVYLKSFRNPLTKGKYRISKEIENAGNKKTYQAEFEIY